MLQIEKRGVVLGDRTAGAVTRAVQRTYTLGLDQLIVYGASITDADLLTSNGERLEGRGVTPDELILPSPQDLFAGRDPVLARAAELVGMGISSEDAGKMFPGAWDPPGRP